MLSERCKLQYMGEGMRFCIRIPNSEESLFRPEGLAIGHSDHRSKKMNRNQQMLILSLENGISRAPVLRHLAQKSFFGAMVQSLRGQPQKNVYTATFTL